MKKKKVGIITVHKSPNYGASLQSYALFKFIEQHGYKCELIDLLRPYHKEYKVSHRFGNVSSSYKFKRVVKKNIKSLTRYDKRNYREKKVYETKYKDELSIRERAFVEFSSCVKLSPQYVSVDDLYNNPPVYDIYVSGSDQIWNPTQPYHIEPYFLTFHTGEGRKISYASSIGLTELSEEYKRKFSQWLSGYDRVSVREKEAKELLKNLLDKEISVVMDPAFLLDLEYWRELSVKPDIQEKYLFCFTLNYNEKLLEYSKNIAKQANLKLVIIGHCLQDAESLEYESVLTAGPREWMGLIENAELVITDSFHATVFSIMLSRNFTVYIDPSSKRGSRIINLLDIFDLGSHLLDSDLTQTYDNLSPISLDRNYLDRNIKLKLIDSKEYLLEALKC